jgi:vitamin B12 transporter
VRAFDGSFLLMKTFVTHKRGCAPVRFCASVLAVMAAFPVLAQSKPEATLAETVVTANRSEQLLVDALPHTTVIARDVIERSQAVDLPTLLSSEAGFQFTQNGGRGTSSNLFLRGSASLGVLVLLDGVPMTKQDSTGSVSLEHIMLDQVERVEIVRGNVSAIYGSGAIGGVVQVFTRQGNGKPAGFVQLEAGSYGTTRAAAGFSGQAGDTRFAVGVGAHRTDGFSSMDATQNPNENPDADGYRNTNYSLTLSHELAKGHRLGLRAQGSEGEFDFDGGGSGTATDVFKGRNSTDSWSLYSHNKFSSNWRSELTLSQGREKSVYDAKLTASPYDSEAVTRSRTVNWTNTVDMGNWLATLGAENQLQAIDTDDSYATRLNRERNVTALFAGLSGTVGMHSVQVNVRQDNADGLGAQTTGYLGYGFNLTPTWKVIASTSTAFNLPPLGYLYDPFSGNPQLKPETARSHELGLQWAQGGQVVRATVFSTRVSDMMLYDFATYSFNNVSDASNKGLEVSYSGKLAGADLRASLTQQDPVNEGTGGQMMRRAKTMASFGASLPWGAWTLGGDVRYTGERPDVPARPMLDAYTVANLTASYTLTPELALTARVDNLFDSQYQTAFGYNQSGRAGYVGIVWKQK